MRVVQTPAKPNKQSKHKLPWKLTALLFMGIVIIFIIVPILHKSNTPSSSISPVFNKSLYSLNDPNSIWVVVDKGRVLPSSYIPPDLVVPNVALRLEATDPEMQIRAVAAPALQQMFTAASRQNIHLMLSSGYRSYILQNTVYSGYVSSEGQKNADSSSAKPGFSEHQTGLALDVEPTSRECEVQDCFGETPEGKWLAENSYKYGFIVRYQKGKEQFTGYEYEPWHVRYVGKQLAMQTYKSNQTLEQFFGLPTVLGYTAKPYSLGTSN